MLKSWCGSWEWSPNCQLFFLLGNPQLLKGWCGSWEALRMPIVNFLLLGNPKFPNCINKRIYWLMRRWWEPELSMFLECMYFEVLRDISSFRMWWKHLGNMFSSSLVENYMAEILKDMDSWLFASWSGQWYLVNVLALKIEIFSNDDLCYLWICSYLKNYTSFRIFHDLSCVMRNLEHVLFKCKFTGNGLLPIGYCSKDISCY